MKACPKETTLAGMALGNLSPRKAAGVKSHLKGCSRCAAALQDFRLLAQVLKPVTEEVIAGAVSVPDPKAIATRVAKGVVSRIACTERRSEIIRRFIWILADRISELDSECMHDPDKGYPKSAMPETSGRRWATELKGPQHEVLNMTAKLVDRLLCGRVPLDERRNLARVCISKIDPRVL